MRTVLSNSLCSICAGESNRYFFGKKALVSQEVCHAVLDRCAVSFKFLVGLSAISEDFNNKLESLAEIEKQEDASWWESLMKKFLVPSSKHIINHQSNELTKLLTKYINHLNNQTAPAKNLQADLCSNLLNIHSKTYLEQSIHMFRSFPEVFRGIFKSLLHRHKSKYSKTKHRLLSSKRKTSTCAKKPNKVQEASPDKSTISLPVSDESNEFGSDVIVFVSGQLSSHSVISNFKSSTEISSQKQPLSIRLTPMFP